MDIISSVTTAINYIEDNILEDINFNNIAKHVYISPFYFHKIFAAVTDMTINEYIRNRRLSLAGQEVISTENKVIDIALKYGYDTPESFTKAFTRFHGVSPAAMRKNNYAPKFFNPIKLSVIVKGGNFMNFKIEKKPAFRVLGISKEFPMGDPDAKVPMFWDEYLQKGLMKKVSPKYGLTYCESPMDKTFKYSIGDDYKDGDKIPEGFEITDIPSLSWAVFPCTGKMPDALRKLTKEIYSDWMMNSGYTINAPYSFEMYPSENLDQDDYYCEIWVPVETK